MMADNGGAVKWEIIVGGLTGLGVVVGLVSKALNAADTRADERFKLMLSNGGGALLQEKVKAAVLEALREHQITCPHATRIESVEERLVTLERAG